ncbi:unnamed protein product [Knipowitschia caucasica]
MHTDNQLANHGKVVSESQSRSPSVSQQAQQQQSATGHLGPKGVGGHGVKSGQALKSGSQSLSSAGGMLKTKTKRERSVSMDSDDKNMHSSVESDAKAEGIMRSKRRCVLERKQPYSGDEWCSGPDTEDEDKPHNLIHREKTLVGPVKGVCDLQSEPGSGLKVEPKQTIKQLVYVFTTNLANSAADAVLKGQSDSILLFHQQNVSCSKLEQGHLARKKISNMPEKVRSSSSPPSSTPKSQSGTPRPSSAGAMGMTQSSLEQSNSEMAQTRTSDGQNTHNTTIMKLEGGCLPADIVSATRDREALRDMVHPFSTASPSHSPTLQSAHTQSAQVPKLCPENLSKEQLEHRVRSLQTLRDIERIFLRNANNAEAGDPESSSNNPNNPSSITERSGILDGSRNGRAISGSCTTHNVLSSSPMGNMRKYEEPLQSIISQTESLRGSQHHNSDHPHHQMSPSRMEIAHFLGPEGLSPEQIAWRKLQEEYYQEKRRQQEAQPTVHSEMGIPAGPMMVRGPPPPYHSKPGEQQWPTNMMGGGVRRNTQILDMSEGPQGSRFLGQISRGPAGGGFPDGSESFPLEGVGHQRPIRPAMLWLDEMPNNDNKGPVQGVYTGGPPQHLQGHAESSNHPITREEIIHILEKRQMQGLPRSELVQLAKHLQYNMQRPNRMMRPPLSSQNDPMDFPTSHVIVGSPGAGPQIKDLVESPPGSNIPLNMKMVLNAQQHQQLNLAQKFKGSLKDGSLNDLFGPAGMSQARNVQYRQEGNRAFNHGSDGAFQFSNQDPFTGGNVEGSYLQNDSEMFEEMAPNQIGGTMRLSHMPVTENFKGPDARARHHSDPTLKALSSPSLPAPHQLNSPSIDQVPSPLLPSSSRGEIKSPSHVSSSVAHQPPLPAAGPGTPTSIKSPHVVGSSNHGLHSPSASPRQLKSPAVSGAAGSPGWTSPKPALPSPGLASGKIIGKGGPSVETGPPLPTRSLNSTTINQPGSTNTSIPFTSSTEAPPSQNPLSLIMSQMSKYAMPSSMPLYHEAIKTLASSDDEMMPDRPLLSGVCIGGNIGNAQSSQLLGPDPQSPIGIISHGQQQLPHEMMLSSPNQMAMSSMNSVMIGADGIVASLCQNQMGGFPRLHTQQAAMVQNFSQPNDNILPPQQLHLISKGHPHQRNPPRDAFNSLPVGDGPDLSEVIRPTQTGIPEFDLSRIIPCDKPSSILQYFPKSNPAYPNPPQGPPSQHNSSQQLLKQLSSSIVHGSGPSSNPHIANLQNMMADQQLQPPSHVGRQGLGGSRGMVSGAGIGPMCPPGHMMGRPVMSLQQQQHGMMPNNPLHHSAHPYQGMMPSQQHSHNTMAQHNMMMMMQAKQQGLAIPGDPFGPQGHLMSPQVPMMGPPQPGMMGPQSIRQRGTPMDSSISYGSGANIPF